MQSNGKPLLSSPNNLWADFNKWKGQEMYFIVDAFLFISLFAFLLHVENGRNKKKNKTEKKQNKKKTRKQ